MSLTITIPPSCLAWVYAIEPKLHPAQISIFGKSLFVYWLEWSRDKGYTTLTIKTTHPLSDEEYFHNFATLYEISLDYQVVEEIDEDLLEDETHKFGLGIFFDDGSYQRFEGLDALLSFEDKMLHHDLKYSAAVGYGRHKDVLIGKESYVHPSVNLIVPVIIGDNCVLEEGVVIEDSVINDNVIIKRGSTIIDSHVARNLKILHPIYLNNKALFQEHIYDQATKETLVHTNVCESAK